MLWNSNEKQLSFQLDVRTSLRSLITRNISSSKSHWCYTSRDIFFCRWTFYATEINAAISRSSFEWKMFIRSGEIRISSSFQMDVNLIFRQNVTKTSHHIPSISSLNILGQNFWHYIQIGVKIKCNSGKCNSRIM